MPLPQPRQAAHGGPPDCLALQQWVVGWVIMQQVVEVSSQTPSLHPALPPAQRKSKATQDLSETPRMIRYWRWVVCTTLALPCLIPPWSPSLCRPSQVSNLQNHQRIPRLSHSSPSSPETETQSFQPTQSPGSRSSLATTF